MADAFDDAWDIVKGGLDDFSGRKPSHRTQQILNQRNNPNYNPPYEDQSKLHPTKRTDLEEESYAHHEEGNMDPDLFAGIRDLPGMNPMEPHEYEQMREAEALGQERYKNPMPHPWTGGLQDMDPDLLDFLLRARADAGGVSPHPDHPSKKPWLPSVPPHPMGQKPYDREEQQRPPLSPSPPHPDMDRDKTPKNPEYNPPRTPNKFSDFVPTDKTPREDPTAGKWEPMKNPMKNQKDDSEDKQPLGQGLANKNLGERSKKNLDEEKESRAAEKKDKKPDGDKDE